MIGSGVNKIQAYFSQGHARTVRAKINITGGFLLKGIGVLLSMLIVPMTINYVSPNEYGVWIAISSAILWLSFFDIGFGNGLRNKFVEAIANGNKELAKIYVSTTYAILALIISIVWVIAAIAANYVDWARFLNAPRNVSNDLTKVVLIVLTTFALQFILGLITTILNALQKSVMASLYNTVSQVLVLIGIAILTKTTQGSLVYLGLLMGGVNVLVLTIFSLWFYTHDLKEYLPGLKYVKFGYAKNLMGLGLKFFLIQIIALIYYETNNIIIIKILSPASVSVYDVGYKYMSVIGMFFTILITPFWSAFAEAQALGDYQWMKNVAKKLRLITFAIAAGALVLVVVSPFIYKIWLRDMIAVPFTLTLLLGVWQIFHIWNTLHSTLIYGIGKIKLQLVGSLFVGIINLPIAIYFCSRWQLNGIIFSQILMSASISWIGVIQLNKLLNKSAHGIWDR
jgi:O-antigen/teichoic acid export membrane protein